MTAIEEEDDIAVAAQADDIAKKLTQYLIDGFKTKTGRDPSNDEIEQLFEELTPERVTELLGQETSLNTSEEGSPEDGNEEDEADDDDDEEGDDGNDDDCKVGDADEGEASNGSLKLGSELTTGQVVAQDIDNTDKECKRSLAATDNLLSEA